MFARVKRFNFPKVELCETAFIHAIPFSTMKRSETGKDGEKKRKRSLIKHPYPGVKS